MTSLISSTTGASISASSNTLLVSRKSPRAQTATKTAPTMPITRIQPDRAPDLPTGESNDREDRGGRICQHVQIGCPKVQVLVLMAVMFVMMGVIMIVVVMMTALQQPGADQIYDQADRRQRNGLVIVNRKWRDEALDGLKGHESRYTQQ